MEILAENVKTTETFENNFGTNHKFIKYLKESCVLDFDQHSPSNIFFKIAIVREISPKDLGSDGSYSDFIWFYSV